MRTLLASLLIAICPTVPIAPARAGDLVGIDATAVILHHSCNFDDVVDYVFAYEDGQVWKGIGSTQRVSHIDREVRIRQMVPCANGNVLFILYVDDQIWSSSMDGSHLFRFVFDARREGTSVTGLFVERPIECNIVYFAYDDGQVWSLNYGHSQRVTWPERYRSGACCHADGSCTIGPIVECQPPSIYQGDESGCQPNPCPPGGACCHPDGTCAVTIQTLCEASSVWLGPGIPCSPDPCPSFGACCQSDGACAVSIEANCPAPGIWQGAATTCEPNPCMTGACCLVAYCLRCTVSECAGYGGTYEGNGTLCDPNPCPTSAVDAGSETPSSLSLRAIPNPATGDILIEYGLPAPMAVTIEIFNAGGSLVRRIAAGMQSPGRHAIPWDALDSSGHPVPSGVYLARIVTSEGTRTVRVVVAR